MKVAVGSMHVVVLTETNEMYVWGRNDQAQLGDSPNAAITDPTLMSALHGKTIIGISCGPAQVIYIYIYIYIYNILLDKYQLLSLWRWCTLTLRKEIRKKEIRVRRVKKKKVIET